MTEARQQHRRGWVLFTVGLLLFIGAFAAFDAYMKSIPATTSAKAFVSAIRAGQAAEVRAHVTADLLVRLDAMPGAHQGELARAYERIRGSASVEGSFFGDWTVGCMEGMIAAFGPIWFVMAKQRGSWFVADLRIDRRPKECDPDDVD
jgi:hypothetical protein